MDVRAKIIENLMLWVALVAGFGLIGVAVILKSQDPYFEYRGFVLACGIAAVFAGIGSTASVKYKGLSATGAAAIAIGLFNVMRPDPSQDQYVRGLIEGSEMFRSLYIRGSKPFLSGRAGRDAPFEYVAYKEELASDTLVITAELSANGRDITIGCIPIALVRNALMSKRANFRLTFNKETEVWTFGDQAGHYGEFGSTACSTKGEKAASIVRPKATHAGISRLFFGTAYAESGKDIRVLVAALKSDELPERTAARDALARARSTTEFGEMSEAWDIDQSDYRTDLGLISAWVSAIRADRAVAPKVFMSLSAMQLDYLVALTGYPDKTMRLNATEALSWFLQSTGWPGTPPGDQKTKELQGAMQKFFQSREAVFRLPIWKKFDPNAADPLNRINVIGNSLVAMQNAICSMKPALKEELERMVKVFADAELTNGRFPSIATRVSTFSAAKASC